MTQCVLDYDHPRFGGETFSPELDGQRLARQLQSVWFLMRDGEWRTLDRIATVLEFPEASVSARLRDLRKRGLTVERRRVTTTAGLWEYRVLHAS